MLLKRVKYQKGQELQNANQKRAYPLGPETDFIVAKAQAHRNQLHNGTQGPQRNVSIGTFTSYRLNRCATGTQSGGEQKASIQSFSFSISYLYLQRFFFPDS